MTSSSESKPEASEPRAYSKAFENMMTDGPNDLVGLIAYALLKQNIREEAQRGVTVTAFRNPTQLTVDMYRDLARQRLANFAANAIDEAVPEIQESAALSAIREAESSLREHITSRTNALSAIATNIAAWAVTAVLAFIVIVGLSTTGLYDRMTNSAATMFKGPAVDAPATPSSGG